MDTEGGAVNLSEEDIVKDTQFFSEDLSASQLPSNIEARFMYGSSQPGAYSQTPYLSYGGMRPPQMNHSQDSRCPPISPIPCGQVNAWTNYGGALGPAVPPMMQMFGNAFYPSFQTPTFSGMTPRYAGISHGGMTDSFLHTPVGQSGGGAHGVEWTHLQNGKLAVHEEPRRVSISEQYKRNEDPRPLSTRPSVSSGGHWICPRKKLAENDKPAQSSGGNVQVSGGSPSRIGNSRKLFQSARNSQASEIRHSPRRSSAETQQGPLPSDSVDAEHTGGPSHERTKISHGTPLSEPRSDVRGLRDSSKSNSPGYLKKRKALREDEKLYLREVKLAITEGRVPQVTVVQDEEGNLVRYRSQFFNALKVAAHAVVQDAYINVYEKETMNEIMDEVKRQFVFPRPLPAGMVEGYLKGYFKRCRLEYHQFWIKYGDKKKPDGCKRAAWLELVEYWKSAEGSRECQRNRRNGSAEKQKSLEMDEMQLKNEKLDVQCETKADVGGENEATGSPGDVSRKSDSLGFSNGTPLTTPPSSAAVARFPMADISNQLHEAVDNILLSYVRSNFSLPKSSMKGLKAEEGKGHLQSIGSQSVKSSRVGIRTPAEVIGSLQRPPLDAVEEKMSLPKFPNAEIQCRTCVKPNLKKAAVTKCNGDFEFSVVNQEAVQLSSGSSSGGTKVTGIKMPKRMRPNDNIMTMKRVYREEREGLPYAAPENVTAVKAKGKEPIVESEVPLNNQRTQNFLSHSKDRKVVGEQEPLQQLGQKEENRKISGSIPGTCSHKNRIEVNSTGDGRLNEENEEQDERDVDMDNESQEDEPPVLPREIVKRKLDVEYGSNSGKKDSQGKLRKRSSKTPVKKQKGTGLDPSILRRMKFYRRPKNSHPIKTRTPVWILHPTYVGKVVAEGTAGVNRKSRCVDSANELCKEGQQMIFVQRVLYKNVPVMYDKNSRFPRQISYLDQAEGLPNTPVLWCSCHLIEIPPYDKIAKLMGQFIQPSTEEMSDSDESDFEDSQKKSEPRSKVVIPKENRKGRLPSVGVSSMQGLKGSKVVLRSADA